MNFSFHHLPTYSLLILSSIMMLTACQKPPPELPHEHDHQITQANTAPDLGQICQDLKKEMQEMNDQRTTLALEQINQDIRMCLPLISLKEQKQLLKLSDQMYAQFLKVERTPLQQTAFEQYAQNESQYPTIQQNLFEQLHIRDQYLLRHKGQAYIELMDDGKNHLFYRRNPQYFAKVFAPDLPEADSVFITEMADQNEHPLLKGDQLDIPPDEIMRRALFWENYLNVYPESSWRSDAEYLYQTYTNLLFKGLAEQSVSEKFDGKSDIQPQTLMIIEQLAEQKGKLAEKAQRFLKFIDMTPEQRQKINRHPSQEQHNNSQLLDAYLQLQPINLSTLKKRDCFSDALCR